MLILAGAGPGNVKLLTKEVKEIIDFADTVIAFNRIAQDIKDLRQEVIPIKSVTEIEALLFAGVEGVQKKQQQEKNILILASGDSNFFGIADYLRKNNIRIDKTLCGISSVQYFASKLNRAWQNIKTFSFHGRKADFAALKRELDIAGVFFLLTDKENNPCKVSQNLKALGAAGKIYTGYNLSYPEEKIEVYSLGEMFEVISDLNTVFVEAEYEKH